MLLAIDLDEDFIDVEGVAKASVLSLQSPSVNSSEFDTPKSDSFSTDGDTALGEKVFDAAVTEIETIIEPDCVGNDVRRASVALVCVHPSILSVVGF